MRRFHFIIPLSVLTLLAGCDSTPTETAPERPAAVPWQIQVVDTRIGPGGALQSEGGALTYRGGIWWSIYTRDMHAELVRRDLERGRSPLPSLTEEPAHTFEINQ